MQFAFNVVDIEIKWEEVVYLRKVLMSKQERRLLKLIRIIFDLFAEVDDLIGDYSKAEKELGWIPTTKIQEMCVR